MHTAAKFGLPTSSVAPEESRHRSFYRPCVVCGQLMNRINYGHSSGVIVDVCRDHGIWFDADELARILTWLRAGGGVEDGSMARPADTLPPSGRSAFQPPRSFLGALFDFLFGLPD